MQRLSVVAVFEGNDAAGKGGAIRRVTSSLDARRYSNISIAAPTEEERAQPYLWRFWRHIPGRGRFALYDRSWYGRVLVERVEGFCSEADWLRAYRRDQRLRAGAGAARDRRRQILVAVSKDEQMRRFKQREKVSFKRFKITPAGLAQPQEMGRLRERGLRHGRPTSTPIAPWTLVEANNVLRAHQGAETLTNALEAALDGVGGKGRKRRK